MSKSVKLRRLAKYEQIIDWVQEYYTPEQWKKIVYCRDRRVCANRNHNSVWDNFTTNADGTGVQVLPFPSQYTRQMCIRINNYHLNFEPEENDSDVIVVKPYWWSMYHGTDLCDNRDEIIPLVATRKNVHRILSTVPLDPLPLWWLRIKRNLQTIRETFKFKYRIQRILRNHQYKNHIWGTDGFDKALREYFGETQWTWMCVSGRGINRTNTEYQDNGSRTETSTFDHHGFVFEIRYQSTHEGERLGRKYPFSCLSTRIILRPGKRQGLAYCWYSSIHKKELFRLLRWIERDFAPAIEWPVECR